MSDQKRKTNRPTAAQRAAQSARDKKKAQQSRSTGRTTGGNPRRARTRGKNFGGGVLEYSSIPAARTFRRESGKSIAHSGLAMSKDAISPGDRYNFRQIITGISIGTPGGVSPNPGMILRTSPTTIASSYAQSGFIISNLGFSPTSSGWFLSPYWQGGRLATIASIFTQYAYRKLKIRYVPQTGTNVGAGSTQNYGLAFAVSTDPYIWPEDGNGSGSPSFSEVSNVDPGFQCSAYGDFKKDTCIDLTYTGPKTWNNQYSLALAGEQAADLRLEHQYRLCAMTNYLGTPTDSVLGTLEISGTVDFYGPVQGLSSNGFTLSRVSAPKCIEWEKAQELKHKYDAEEVDRLTKRIAIYSSRTVTDSKLPSEGSSTTSDGEWSTVEVPSHAIRTRESLAAHFSALSPSVGRKSTSLK